MKCIVVGDIHSNWGHLNKLIDKKKPDYILQCGDFGWWPHMHGVAEKRRSGQPKAKPFNQFGIENHDTKVFWVSGNHENWDDLHCITDYTPLETQDGVTYCPFGTVLELQGKNILMVGGAESVDKEWRVEGQSWWRNEIISQEDMDNLPDCDIDVVISHTAPRNWVEAVNWGFTMKNSDPSTFALQLIFERYRPSQWFSGHFHHYLKTEIDDCVWTSLSCSGISCFGRWWEELKF